MKMWGKIQIYRAEISGILNFTIVCTFCFYMYKKIFKVELIGGSLTTQLHLCIATEKKR